MQAEKIENSLNAEPLAQVTKLVQIAFCIVTLLFSCIILWVNQGQFSFVLDDPFIHLSLAEQLLHGNYGINLGEAAAPSSSIVWPFFLAPFASFHSVAPYVLLIMNTVFSVLLIRLLSDFLALANFADIQKRQAFILLSFLFLASNSFALVFVGMEHNLQVLLAAYVFVTLLRYQACLNKLPTCFYIALALMPLVRYENMAIVVPVLALLLFCGEWKRPVFVAAVIAVCLIGFSAFLYMQGLGYLPSSIQLKSAFSSSLSERIVAKVDIWIHTPKVWLMCFALFLLLKKAKQSLGFERQLAFVVLASSLLFVLLGSFGWYYRYEAFAWLFLWMGLIYLYTANVAALLTKPFKWVPLFLIINIEHILVSLVVPIAANNIYLQQYQMARFVHDYYQQNVAVNDIGWVGYLNDVYVLDLWGLASYDALAQRSFYGNQHSEWMQPLTELHQVGLVMIYYNDQGDASGWFESVPDKWRPIGQLSMQAMGITVARRNVVFFATSVDAEPAIKEALVAFESSLPPLTHFEWFVQSSNNKAY